MLWACEERPEEFWAEDSLVHSIQQLLMEIAEWLTAKFCCNYFIRDNNMMDHLVDTDVSSDASALLAASVSRDLVTHITALCVEEESLANTVTVRSELPIWLHRSIIIMDRVNNIRDNYRDLGSKNFTEKLKTVSVQELTDVYRGLACHREAVICDTVGDKCRRRAEEHFTACYEIASVH